MSEVSNRRMMPYPEGAVEQALKALELAYSYLREKPIIEVEIRDAIQRLERFRELTEKEHS